MAVRKDCKVAAVLESVLEVEEEDDPLLEDCRSDVSFEKAACRSDGALPPLTSEISDDKPLAGPADWTLDDAVDAVDVLDELVEEESALCMAWNKACMNLCRSSRTSLAELVPSVLSVPVEVDAVEVDAVESLVLEDDVVPEASDDGSDRPMLCSALATLCIIGPPLSGGGGGGGPSPWIPLLLDELDVLVD